jgi:hypothetical protein
MRFELWLDLAKARMDTDMCGFVHLGIPHATHGFVDLLVGASGLLPDDGSSPASGVLDLCSDSGSSRGIEKLRLDEKAQLAEQAWSRHGYRLTSREIFAE